MKQLFIIAICLTGNFSSHAQQKPTLQFSLPEINVTKKSYWGVGQMPVSITNAAPAKVSGTSTLPLDHMPFYLPQKATTALIPNKLTPLHRNGIPNAVATEEQLLSK